MEYAFAQEKIKTMALMVEEANGKTRQVLTCFLLCPLYLSVVSALSLSYLFALSFLFVHSPCLICPLSLSLSIYSCLCA